MSFLWFLQLLTLALFLYTDMCFGADRQCNAPEWFGLPCRYKCNCVAKKCDNNGECTGGSMCEKGWFGPACQYVDLVATNTTASTPAWVYDYPDRLCNTGQETVTISLDNTYYFTWLRFRASVTVSPKDITIQLMDATDRLVECTNIYKSSVNDTLLDIHCQQGAFFQKLSITGAWVKWLCSVMVSGGRNVALGQTTTQTSILQLNPPLPSFLAVDGDSDSFYLHWHCSHTNYEDPRPTWTLAFDRSYNVNRYALYNRRDLQERLRGFILEAYRENGSVAFNYTDHTNTNQAIYRIPSNTPFIPVSSVNITATFKDLDGFFLTLCEVEMFGDTVCPAGYYGRDCNKSCNCAKSGDSCFVSTGRCPSGCAAGYHWDECQTPCSQTYFGVDCLQKCSTNCTSQFCQPNNGTCLSCIRGKQGPLCDSDCKPTFWGDNCATPCRLDCKNALCDAVTGKCFSCAAGRSGENCDQVCNATHHGENCALPCSSNCTDHLCNPTNGHCQSCLTGKSGIFCDEACPPGTFGEGCKETCSTNCTSQLCEAVSGKCASCLQGLTGDYCNEECDFGFYGTNCTEPCSNNCNGTCNKQTGACLNGCLPGYLGEQCDKECDFGFHGTNCTEPCSNNCNGTCNKQTGACLNGCLPGYLGEQCDKECDFGFHGTNCTEPCSNKCYGTCNKQTGSCLYGCLPGYVGAQCDKVITTPATITFDPITNTTEASKTVRQDFECHLNYMHVFIPVELVPNSQLTLRELNCRLLNNGTHHKISFDYDECGTSQSFFEDYISIDNEVNVHNILNNTAEITFVEDYTIPLKCLVDRSKHVNGAIQVISRESIHENAVQSTDFHMKEFTTKDYDLEITAYPIQLPINREIFFEVALTNSSSNSTGIFVEKCEATPSIHRNGTVRVSLIHFGCSVNPAVKVLPVPEIDRFRFSIQAFHFSGPENVDNMVYVHCSASTCGGVMCDNTCPKSSRRRRRSTRGQASATLTSGSHVVG